MVCCMRLLAPFAGGGFGAILDVASFLTQGCLCVVISGKCI